jgi:hypothetical protein
VLRLLDARTGSYAEVRPTRPGLLRVRADVPGAAAGSDITWLRVLLVADLLARAAELRNLQVFTVLVADGELPGQPSAWERAVGALGIHPAAGHAGSGGASASLDGPADVRLADYGIWPGDDRSGLAVRVGAAHIHGTGDHAKSGVDLLTGSAQNPLAVRFALMSFPAHQPADLTSRVLASAHQTVGDWRRRVARWAEQPSRPIPTRLAEMARTAFDDLDTAAAIALLRGLADDESVPDGAKFETFLYVDRVLGLDLPSEIGKVG